MAGAIGYAKRYPLTTVKKFSFADNNASWRARRQASNERFFAQQTATANLFNAGVNAVAGQVQLTTQLVNARLQGVLDTQAAEREQRLNDLSARLDKTV